MEKIYLPQLIKPGSVKIMTQDGEVKVTIALELTINLNSDAVHIAAANNENVLEKSKSFKENKIDWMIPDFGTSTTVDFGKKE
jgi:hypothetical protein